MAAETKNFRVNVAALCANHGEIQRIADASGISRVHLSRIIHGHNVPTMDVASRIAKALEVSLADLIGPPEKLSRILARAS